MIIEREKFIGLQDYDVVFLDFDGVIKESTTAKTEGFAQLFSAYGQDVQNQVVHHHHLNSGISRFEKIPYYFKAFLGRSLSEEELKTQCEKYSILTNDAVVNASWVDGVRQYLVSYCDQQDIYVVTGTPQEDIDWIVAKIGIENQFKGVFGSPRSKIEILSELIHHHSYNRKNCILVGDLLSDYTAATEVKVDFLLRVTIENLSMFEDIHCPRISDFKDILCQQ